MKPEISIVLPVWNGERYLTEAISSVLNQTLENFELIIVNDCSTDSSLNIALSFAAKDQRVVVISNEKNSKLPASLNAGFRRARGSFYTWISDDNLLKENFLREMRNSFDSQSYDIVFSDYNHIDEDGTFVSRKSVGPVELLAYTNSIGASFMYKKEVHETLNGFDEKLFLIEDYDFWVRAFGKGFKYKYLEDVLYDYRVHSNSLTSTSNINKLIAPYLFEKRNSFKKCSSESNFKCRTSILFNGTKTLTIKQKVWILVEVVVFYPWQLIKFILNRRQKVLRFIFQKSAT